MFKYTKTIVTAVSLLALCSGELYAGKSKRNDSKGEKEKVTRFKIDNQDKEKKQNYVFPSDVMFYALLPKVDDIETKSKLVQTCKEIRSFFYKSWNYEGGSCSLPPVYTHFFNDGLFGTERAISRFILDFELNIPEGRVAFIDTYGNPKLHKYYNYNDSSKFFWHEEFRNFYSSRGTTELKNLLSNSKEQKTLNLKYDDPSVPMSRYLLREIGELKSLEELRCREGFIALSPKLCGLSKLKVIDLEGADMICGHQPLKVLPVQFGDLSSLEVLLLGLNDLELLPSSFTKLSKLKKLSLARNRFKCFPEELLSLSGLEDLSFSNMKFSGFVSTVKDEDGNYYCLKYADRVRNDIMPLPNDFCSKLTKLKRLDLSGNTPILPKGFSTMTAMEVLHLDDMGDPFCYRLEEFNPEDYPANLEELSLSNNCFSEIPQQLTCLKRLKKLIVNSNSNDLDIPEELKSNSNLKILTYK